MDNFRFSRDVLLGGGDIKMEIPSLPPSPAATEISEDTHSYADSFNLSDDPQSFFDQIEVWHEPPVPTLGDLLDVGSPVTFSGRRNRKQNLTVIRSEEESDKKVNKNRVPLYAYNPNEYKGTFKKRIEKAIRMKKLHSSTKLRISQLEAQVISLQCQLWAERKNSCNLEEKLEQLKNQGAAEGRSFN